MAVTGGIVAVQPPFAHTFADLPDAEAHLEHARTNLGFANARLVAAPVFDPHSRDYLHAEIRWAGRWSNSVTGSRNPCKH